MQAPLLIVNEQHTRILSAFKLLPQDSQVGQHTVLTQTALPVQCVAR